MDIKLNFFEEGELIRNISEKKYEVLENTNEHIKSLYKNSNNTLGKRVLNNVTFNTTNIKAVKTSITKTQERNSKIDVYALLYADENNNNHLQVFKIDCLNVYNHVTCGKDRNLFREWVL